MAYAGRRFFKRAQLRQRGWTNGMINLLMPDPDGTIPTDHPKAHAGSFRVFHRDRVRAIEGTTEFQRLVAERLAKRKALGCCARSPLELLLDGIVVPVIAWDRLVNLACDNYNDWCLVHSSLWRRRISSSSSPSFVARVCVNYLRHNLTDYDELLKENVRRLGIHVYPLVKRRVIEQIVTRYPRLVGECYRQLMLMSSASKGTERET
jgi:hypothetical protein